jgi:hypothetical protein
VIEVKKSQEIKKREKSKMRGMALKRTNEIYGESR